MPSDEQCPARDDLDATGFFEAVLPWLLSTRATDLITLTGVIQFYLLGRVDRAWYVDLRGEQPTTARGLHDWPDVNVYVSEACLGPMVRGELDVEDATAREQLAVDGDAAVLARLGSALAEHQSWHTVFAQSR